MHISNAVNDMVREDLFSDYFPVSRPIWCDITIRNESTLVEIF